MTKQIANTRIHPITRKPVPVRSPAETKPVAPPQIEAQPESPVTAIEPAAQAKGSRDKLVVTVRRHIKRGQHVLLVGKYGSGRTWMLERMRQEFPDALILSVNQKRTCLLTVCERMYRDEVLFIDGAEDWTDALKKLRSLTIPQLNELIGPYLSDYRFIVDDLDGATEKAVLEIIRPLMSGTVLAAADIGTPTKRKRVQGVLDRFKQIEMPALDEDEAKAMLWSLLDRTQLKNANTIEKRVLRLAQGVPGVIFDACEQLRGSGGSLADIRELEHSNTPVKRINLGVPLLIAALIMLMSSRYFFRGFDDSSLIILAGVGSVLASVILRPMVYRMMQS